MTFPNLLILLILLFAPGLAARAAFPALTRGESIGEAIFGVLFASILVSGWIGLVLAEFGLFSLTAVCALALILSLVVLVARRRSVQSPIPNLRLSVWGIAALMLLILAAWLFFRPHEYVLGGRDHGVYVNTGATIARTGGILLADPLLSSLSPEERLALVEPRPLLPGSLIASTWHAGISTVGYYLFHLDSPVIAPHGFHLYPIGFALLNSAGGLEFSLSLTPALAWLSLCALLFAVRRAFSPGVAWMTTALLAVNLAQVWYARAPSAEIMVQFLFWSGAWAWIRAIQTEQPAFGLLGGLAWGQIHLAKIDYVMLPLALAVWLTWAWWTGRYRRFHVLGLIVYAAMLTHAALHGALIATSYFFNTIGALAPAALMQSVSLAAQAAATPFELLTRLIAQNAVAIVAVVVALAAVAVGLRRMKGRGRDRWARFAAGRRNWLGLAAGILGLSAYAYLVRPALDASLGASVFVELGWYLGPLAIALGVIGLARRMGRCDPAQGMLLWSLVSLSTAYLIGGSFTYPDHFWAMRRFVPIVVPGLVLLASDAAVSLLPSGVDEWRQALVPLVLLGGMFLSEAEAVRPFALFVENRGVIERLRRLDQEFEPNAVLLFDRDASGAQIGTPLQMIFQRQVGFVDADATPADRLSAVIAGWQSAGRPVYYFSSANQPIELSRFSLDYLRTTVVKRLAAEQIETFRPTRVGETADTFDVYLVLPKQPVEDRVVTLDVGPEASEPMMTGVYADPPMPGLTAMQWTTGSAVFHLKVGGRLRQVLLRMGGLPPSAPPVEIEALADNSSLARITVRPGELKVYTLRIPDAVALVDDVAIGLRMSTWNPRALGLNADRRDLGVLIDWVKVVADRP